VLGHELWGGVHVASGQITGGCLLSSASQEHVVGGELHAVHTRVHTYKVTEDDGDRYAIVPVPNLVFAMLRLKKQTHSREGE
jgi:hypothetical protein